VTLAIFAVGVLVFLITVYGTVVVGGLLLTDRQLGDQPELVPDADVRFGRVRKLILRY
jgi:hypothetical protein